MKIVSLSAGEEFSKLFFRYYFRLLDTAHARLGKKKGRFLCTGEIGKACLVLPRPPRRLILVIKNKIVFCLRRGREGAHREVALRAAAGDAQESRGPARRLHRRGHAGTRGISEDNPVPHKPEKGDSNPSSTTC